MQKGGCAANAAQALFCLVAGVDEALKTPAQKRESSEDYKATANAGYLPVSSRCRGAGEGRGSRVVFHVTALIAGDLEKKSDKLLERWKSHVKNVRTNKYIEIR